ncbi:DUF3054 domain-containing protein [Haloarchaeobius sp. TZWWS8]|uniref:DUF3054 domain-containing protein n=1 Tax=Haloarchaeobius sp. TZWWS8 TaxID=3446121 RepID=UPI003EBB65D1
MATVTQLFGGDESTTGAAGALALADTLVIVGLILSGELRHGVDPIAQAPRVAATVLPFLLGWYAVATLAGAYGEPAFAGGRSTARITVAAWLGGVNLALIARGSPYLPGDSPWTFALVMSGLGAVVLGGVRPLVVGWLKD